MRRSLFALVAVAAAAHAAPVGAASTPKVLVQVVGKTGVVFGATAVTPKAFALRVSGRTCAVAGSTPLAALEALRKVQGPSYAVRDYGSCSRRIADGGSLFVRAIGSAANKGRDGWVYKVGTKGGSTGAADPSGPFGTGKRLAAGDRVLWFWCKQGSRGCQRTLDVTPATTTAAPGATVTVTVRGYDDQGKGKAIRGAAVSLNGATAKTNAAGRAKLIAPSPPGPYLVLATAPGMVDAFPATVVAK